MIRLTTRQPISVDWALLILRLGVGLPMLILHGYGKITAGPELWTRLGGSMGNLGIDFLPTMWGFLAALAESLGALLLVIGFLTRPAAAMLAFTMLVAALRHLNLPAGEAHAGWNAASHAIELGAASVALLLAGPGRFSLSRR